MGHDSDWFFLFFGGMARPLVQHSGTLDGHKGSITALRCASNHDASGSAPQIPLCSPALSLRHAQCARAHTGMRARVAWTGCYRAAKMVRAPIAPTHHQPPPLFVALYRLLSHSLQPLWRTSCFAKCRAGASCASHLFCASCGMRQCRLRPTCMHAQERLLIRA